MSERRKIRGWMGRMIARTEGTDVVKPAPPVPVRELFRTFWPYTRPYRWLIALSAALIVAVPLLDGARLYMIKVTVDDVLTPKDLEPLTWIAPVIVGLSVLGAIASFYDTYLSVWIGQRFLMNMRTDFFRHLQTLSLDFFERRRLGDILSRLTEDIDAIESFVLSGVAEAASSIVRILFFGGALIYLDWRLALVALAVAPGFALLVRSFSRVVKRGSREKRRRSGALTAIAEESLANVALVQAYNRQSVEIDRFHRQNLGAFDATMMANRLKAMFKPLIDVVQSLSGVAVLAVGTVGLQSGRLTLGELLVFIAYLNQLFSPMRSLATLYNSVFGASAGAERVIEFMSHEPTITDAPDAEALPRVAGRIEFDDVTFGYPGAGRTALDDVALTVEPGETVALVGHSGAGKTTLAKLLLRFYDPDQGAVRIDGTDLREVQVDSVRDNVAVLLQETLIFEGSVRDNILFGRQDASEEDVIRAAKAADAHDFIMEMPDGYDTPVGEKGRRLSGGQRQRVAMARAMIREAPILILDEPTTGLDTEAGHRIMDPLRRLMSGRTTLVISHNLLTVRDADRIVVVDQGRIAEQGSHEQLLALDGRYARLTQLTERRLSAEALVRQQQALAAAAKR